MAASPRIWTFEKRPFKEPLDGEPHDYLNDPDSSDASKQDCRIEECCGEEGYFTGKWKSIANCQPWLEPGDGKMGINIDIRLPDSRLGASRALAVAAGMRQAMRYLQEYAASIEADVAEHPEFWLPPVRKPAPLAGFARRCAQRPARALEPAGAP